MAQVPVAPDVLQNPVEVGARGRPRTAEGHPRCVPTRRTPDRGRGPRSCREVAAVPQPGDELPLRERVRPRRDGSATRESPWGETTARPSRSRA
jgi:hypothetical protein